MFKIIQFISHIFFYCGGLHHGSHQFDLAPIAAFLIDESILNKVTKQSGTIKQPKTQKSKVQKPKAQKPKTQKL